MTCWWINNTRQNLTIVASEATETPHLVCVGHIIWESSKVHRPGHLQIWWLYME
jgi:hypothetical protein